MFSMLPTPSAQFSIRFVLFICISHLYMYTQQAATLSLSLCMYVCVCVLNLSLSHVWFAISHNQCWSSVGKSPKLPINLSYWLCLTANLLLLLLLLLQDGKRLQTELDSKSGKAPSILVSLFRYSFALSLWLAKQVRLLHSSSSHWILGAYLISECHSAPPLRFMFSSSERICH